MKNKNLDAATKKLHTACREHNYVGILKALKDGANPNISLEDAYRYGYQMFPIYYITQEIDQRDPTFIKMGADAFAKLHVDILHAMHHAGADFSKSHEGGNVSYRGLMDNLWQSKALSYESTALFLKYGGDSQVFFSEKSFCPFLFGSSYSSHFDNPEALERLWECGLGTVMKERGFKSTILTRLIGHCELEVAQFFINKGVKPAILLENQPTGYDEKGFNSLHIIAQNLRYVNKDEKTAETRGRRTYQSMDVIHQAIDLAISMGDDPNLKSARNATPIHYGFRLTDRINEKAPLYFAQYLAKKGAVSVNSLKNTCLDHACFYAPQAIAQMKQSVAMGSDLLKDGEKAIYSLVANANMAYDKEVLKTLKYFATEGFDFSEPRFVPLQTALAMRGHVQSLKYIYEQGIHAHAKDSHTVAGLAAWHSFNSNGVKMSQELLQLAIDYKAPLELLGADGESALHYAAKALDLKKCRLLLDAGVNPNVLNQHGETPLHLATIRYGKRLNPKVQDIVDLFKSYPNVQWNILDHKKRSILSNSAKNAPLDLLSCIMKELLKKHPDFSLNDKSKHGQQLFNHIQGRADDALAVLEKMILDQSTQNSILKPTPKTQRRI